jgi:peroxiredoxin
MAGSCSTCVLQHLRSVDSWRAQHPEVRVIAVSFTPETEIARFRQEYRLTLPIISDIEWTLSDRYNAAWTPRAYLLTPTGTLLWKQDQMHFDIGQVELALETASKGTNKR